VAQQTQYDSLLEAVGISPASCSLTVLAGGDWGRPSLVLRVAFVRLPSRQGSPALPSSVILKCCPSGSREPEVTRAVGTALSVAPRVLRTAMYGNRPLVCMEDLGSIAIADEPSPRLYREAVHLVAGIHAEFRGRTSSIPLAMWDNTKWTEVVRLASQATSTRFSDGTYALPRGVTEGDIVRRIAQVHKDSCRCMRTLSVLEETAGTWPLTLTHGDYHDGNIVISSDRVPPIDEGTPTRLKIVDWGDARWDTGLTDLVSLIDVARRMGTFDLDEQEVLHWYVTAMEAAGKRLTDRLHEELALRWPIAWILRCWDELRWFAETGEDYGDRAMRELEIIEYRLTMVN
jgi:thiamine kinase-like enzyme